MEPSEKKIIDIFNELKERDLIDPNRKIKASKNIPSGFKASVLTSNTISYNPNFTEGLDDNMIRFGLLHEEGHLKREQHGVSALILLWGLGFVPLIYGIFLNPSVFIISLFFFLFFFLRSGF